MGRKTSWNLSTNCNSFFFLLFALDFWFLLYLFPGRKERIPRLVGVPMMSLTWLCLLAMNPTNFAALFWVELMGAINFSFSFLNYIFVLLKHFLVSVCRERAPLWQRCVGLKMPFPPPSHPPFSLLCSLPLLLLSSPLHALLLSFSPPSPFSFSPLPLPYYFHKSYSHGPVGIILVDSLCFPRAAGLLLNCNDISPGIFNILNGSTVRPPFSSPQSSI